MIGMVLRNQSEKYIFFCGLFNVQSVENWKISLKTALFLVDNYVDDVDSLVNMHKTARNNYAHVYMTILTERAFLLHAPLKGISKCG